jgi:archaellum component FlaF (FlaF/FlaG flagellin family)
VQPRFTAAILALTIGPVIVVAASGQPATAAAARFDRVSVSSVGGQGNHHSRGPAVSGDGRYVAFQSDASNLVPDDTNDVGDIFLRDLRTGTTSRVNESAGGIQANGPTNQGPTISGDGRYVAYVSEATNLVAGDTNQTGDVFVRDLGTGRTTRANVSGTGEQGNRTSDEDYPGSLTDSATISANGRYVAFYSNSSNLVPGDTNGTGDVFVRDLRTGTTTRVSVTDTGAQAGSGGFNPAISGNGRYVGFISDTPDLVSEDTNGIGDVFVRDLVAGTTSRVNVTSTGEQVHDGESYRSYVYLSADGRYVTFTSSASTLVPEDTNNRYDVFLHDRMSGSTSRVSVSSTGGQVDLDSNGPAISADGRFITFHSDVPSPNGMALFLRDRRANTTRMIIVTHAGSFSYGPKDVAISPDGRHVAFISELSSLVPDDTNDTSDVFVWHRTR